MKKIVLGLLCLTLGKCMSAQNVFTYGNHAVSKSEFVHAFNKNPSINPDRKAALKEYLDLYINFKLKVQAAYDEKLDADATQQFELQNFRQQIADNIINDEANVKELVKEAFDRSQKEIHLQQVYVEVPQNADPVTAFNQIQAAYTQLKAGKDFADVVAEYSTDEETKATHGDLGYITVFTLPYNLENIVYGLKVGAFSTPVKTKSGYHIFKNAGERKPLGARRVAQIMVSFPPDPSKEELEMASRKADSIYNLLQKGENFEGLAATVSNDLSSSNNHGELPAFTTGTYSHEFEDVAFGLAKPGDISQPFKTAQGFHILKLLEAKAISGDPNDAAALTDLQDKVRKDARMDLSKEKVIEKKMTLMKYKPGVFSNDALFSYTDSAILTRPTNAVKGITGNSVLFSFGAQNLKASDWIKYLKGIQGNTGDIAREQYPKLYKQYVHAAADENYRANMQLYSDEYTSQVNEFKEANLLFAIMEKNVWGKANTNSAGLRQYYEQHKTKYKWSVSADAIIVTCNNKELADLIGEKLAAAPGQWRSITGSNGSDVTADSGRFELGQLPVIDRTNFTNGLVTAPVKNENDSTYTFNYIIKVYHEPGQRSFDDARGMVISDYQQVVEDKWLETLRKKYPVKVNEAVFNSIK